MEMRRIAWNSISETQKQTVLTSVDLAEVLMYRPEDRQNIVWIEEPFKNKRDEFISVTFKTNQG
ncbi:hypothetical protein DVH26_20380 [Paenibacillus sp. H1-7]|nr:hypothetical protein DVH26_20380 [Paenibacillus sp. H1-7]